MSLSLNIESLGSVKIERGIPIPPRDARKHPKKGYPFSKMKPGDSFFAPGAYPPGKDRPKGAKVLRATTGYQLLPNSSWSLRLVKEEGRVGTRCWRIQ